MSKQKSLSLCREYYAQKLKDETIKSCRKGDRCLFRHPPFINSEDTKEYNRELGFCYCGSLLITVINKRTTINDDFPIFMRVCSRTRRGKNKCKR